MSRAESDDTDSEAGALAPAAAVRDVPLIVGSNLRRLRKARGLSLERLAELSGVSRAMLGQIETAKSVPTVSLLWRVADALGVPVTTLVATDREPAAVVVSRERASVLVASEGRYASRSLLPVNHSRAIGFFELQVAPGHREVVPAAPIGTRHSLVVARGSLAVAVGSDAPVGVAEGDTITFEACRVHAIENPATLEATAYLVVWAPAA